MLYSFLDSGRLLLDHDRTWRRMRVPRCVKPQAGSREALLSGKKLGGNQFVNEYNIEAVVGHILDSAASEGLVANFVIQRGECLGSWK